MIRLDEITLRACLVVALVCLGERGRAEAAEPGATGAKAKAGDHLFRPTPSTLLREMSTDRPDLTESPYTVDAGHAQIEIEAVTLTHDEGADRTGYLGFLVKLGLTPRADLQAGFESLHEDVRDGGDLATPSQDSGLSNLTVRLKWNLWGNDGGSTAFGVMPYVEIPTAEGATDAAGGLILPLAFGGPWGLGLGTMAQVDVLPDEDGEGHHGEWLFTGTVARDLVGDLGGFVEATSGHRPRSEGAWTALVNTGLTWGVTPDLQLDGGARFGVSEAAEGAALFLGVSYRR